MDADEEVWIDMMDSPKLRPVISRFAGGGDEDGEPGSGNDVYHGVARVGGVGGRVIPPDTDTRYSEEPMGYLGWHRDIPPPASYPLPGYRTIKGFVYMYPCNAQGGAGAVVPGSHLLPDAPGQTLKIPMGSGYNNKYEQNELPHSKMANHVCADVDAGDCMIFDTAIWHTGLANASDRKYYAFPIIRQK